MPALGKAVAMMQEHQQDLPEFLTRDDKGNAVLYRYKAEDGQGVSLGDVPPGYEKVDNPPIPIEDSPSLPPLYEVFGATWGGDGTWRLPVLKPELSASTLMPGTPS